MKKLLILFIVLILLSSFVCADEISFLGDVSSGYHFSGNAYDINNLFNGTVNGASLTTDKNSISNQAYSFDSYTEYIDFGTVLNGYYDDFSVSLWVNPDDFSNSRSRIVNVYSATNSEKAFQIYENGGGTLYVDMYYSNSVTSGTVSSAVLPTGVYSNLILTYNESDSNNFKLYVRGVEVIDDNVVGSLNNPTTSSLYVGKLFGESVSDRYFKGKIDELIIINKSLSLSEIIEINNSYDTWDSGSSSVSFFFVSAFDVWSGDTINNFVVSINGTNYSTTEGIVNTTILSNSTSLYNLQIYSNESGGYFSKTYTDYNISEDLTAGLFQSIINFDAYEKVSETLLSDVNFTINNVTNTTFYLSSGVYNVTASKTGYYNKTVEFNVSALDNKTVNITGLFDSVITINLFDVVTENIISETSYVTVTNTSLGYNNTFNSTNGTIQAELIKGSYFLTLWADNYAFSYYNITLNDSVEEYNTTLYSNNSLWVTSYDFNSGAQLYNFSVEVYNDDNVYSFDDNNTGTARQNGIESGVYNVRIDKDGYSSSEYIITVTGGSHQSLTSYLITSASTVIFTMTDVFGGNSIEGVSLSMYKTINSSWTLVNSQATDITGRVQFSYTPGIEYKFIASEANYETKTFYLKPIFSTYTISLTPFGDENELIYNKGYSININPTVFYENMQNNVTVSVSSSGGSLEYYNITLSINGVNTTYNYSNAIGGSYEYEFNISNVSFNEKVTFYIGVKEVGTAYYVNKYNYVIMRSSDTLTLRDWESEGEGFGEFEKSVIATIVLLLIVGIVAVVSGLAGIPIILPTSLTYLVFIGLLYSVGWVTIYPILITGFALLLILITSFGGSK